MIIGSFVEGLLSSEASFDYACQLKGDFYFSKSFAEHMCAAKDNAEKLLLQHCVHQFLDRASSSSITNSAQKKVFQHLQNSAFAGLLFSENVNSKCLSEYV